VNDNIIIIINEKEREREKKIKEYSFLKKVHFWNTAYLDAVVCTEDYETKCTGVIRSSL